MKDVDAPRHEPEVSSSGLFTRSATGLVRGVPPRSSLIINFIPGHPTQTLAAILLFALTVGPGGNPYLALLLVVPMSLAMSYTFGFLTQMIPRSGGDYMLVSRVIHPAVGYVSVFCMTTAGLLSNAFFALAVTTAGIAPLCAAIGLIGGYPDMVEFGSTVSTSKGWQIFFGLTMFAIAGAIQLAGWRPLLKIQNILFLMVTAALVICGLVALIQSKSSFIDNFNDFAQPFTGDPDSYGSTISAATQAGIDVSPGFSFADTIPMVAVFSTTAIFSYWSTFVGGELRQASTMKTANNMAFAGVLGLALVALFTAIFFRGYGGDFLRAAQANGLPAEIAAPGTPFFYLSSIGVGATVYAVAVFVLFIVFWPLITYISSLQQTRAIFAMSFDGVLPKGVTRVNSRGCPWLALLISLLASAAVFIYAVQDQTGFFQILVYAALVQLIAMALVAVSAILAPRLRPALYQRVDVAALARRHPGGRRRRRRRRADGGLRLVGVPALRPARHEHRHGQARGLDRRAGGARTSVLRRRAPRARAGRGARLHRDPTGVRHHVPLEQIVDEARRLLAEAADADVPVRLVGGLAVRIRADEAFHPGLSREYRDIDLVTLRDRGRAVADFLGSVGYEPNVMFNRMNGHERLLFNDPANGRRLDVFVGSFRMCHEIPINERILLEPETVPLAELLLMKLQVVQLNEKDLRDVVALLHHHDVAEHDGDTINAAYMAHVCAGDWGLWRTCKLNVERVRDGVGQYDVATAERTRIDERLERLWARIEAEPKSRGWRMRDRIGDRRQWYEEPEEVEA